MLLHVDRFLMNLKDLIIVYGVLAEHIIATSHQDVIIRCTYFPPRDDAACS